MGLKKFILTFCLGLCVFMAKPAKAEDYCTPYIVQAEKKYKMPHGLLRAIALVESGKGGIPWPWALNDGGQAVYPDTYQEAVKYLRTEDGRPKRNIAIGCMQIYSAYHAHKFSAVEWLLHPEYNVAYSAQLLRKLYKQHGNWTKAVAFYHASSNKKAQYDYVCSVFRTLNRLRGTAPNKEGADYCALMPRTVVVAQNNIPAEKKTYSPMNAFTQKKDKAAKEAENPLPGVIKTMPLSKQLDQIVQ